MSDQLTADEVLTTTRAVRRRLDLERPVDPELVRECVRIALQAPAGSNRRVIRASLGLRRGGAAGDVVVHARGSRPVPGDRVDEHAPEP